MKTLEQVKVEQKFGDVFTLNEFIDYLEEDRFNRYDGIGYFHDGENETDISVWNDTLTWDDVKNFPYVCWYNK